LVFIIAMTTTLKAYQKELIEVFGNVDLGGKKLSNSISGKFNKSMDKARGLKNAALGGAVSGFVNGDGNAMKRFRSAKDMAGYQVMQQGKYMGGFTGNAFMSADKIFDQRRSKMLKEADRQNAAADDMLNRAHSATQASIGKTNLEADQGFEGFDINEPAAQHKLDSYYHNELMNIRSDKQYAGISNVDNARKMGIASWDKKVNSALTDGNIMKGKDGIYRTTAAMADDKDSIEAAYRSNMKEQASLISSAKKVKDNNGIYHYQFDDKNNEKKFNSINNMINDEKALSAHESWMKDSEQYGDMTATEEFNKLKKQGKLADGLNSVNDIYDRKDAMDKSIGDLKDKYSHTSSAISAHQEAVKMASDESQLAANVKHLHDVNSEVTDRSSGAMWSGKKARALNSRGAVIDNAINGGEDANSALAESNYLSGRSRVLHSAGNVISDAADRASAIASPVTSPVREAAHIAGHPFQSVKQMVDNSYQNHTFVPTPPKTNPHYDDNGNYKG
jgi:hypothetical protein